MRKILFVIFCSIALAKPAYAQVMPSATPTSTVVSSESAQATVSAQAEQQPTPTPKVDLTQPNVGEKSQLEILLDDHPVDKLEWYNFLQYVIRRSVDRQVPLNTIVLVMLFPLAVTMVAASRHLLGVRGAGILTPALLSIAFLATGIWAGVALFLIILAVTLVSRSLLKNFRLQYLPRVALLLWFVSAGVLAALVLAGELGMASLTGVGIFPILILMLLAETFIDLQSGRSAGDARTLIFQTFILAILTSLILGWNAVQRAILLWPEAIFFGLAAVDVFMGKYTGLRFSEYLMYRGVVKEDEEE
jgi:hypothetical protein